MHRTLVAVTILLISSSSIAPDNTKEFRRIMNSNGYFGSAAGESWPYPGGFLVMMKNGGNPTFTDLPDDNMKPPSDDVTVDFPAVDQTKTFSLKVVLTGLQALIGGNPGIGFGHTSTMNFVELKAQGKRITYDQANRLVNSQTLPEIQAWMNSGHRVFVVGIALSTKSITLTTDSKWNIDATFNGSVASDCSSNDNNNNSKPTSNDQPNDKPNPSSKQLGALWLIPAAALSSNFMNTAHVEEAQTGSSQGSGTSNSSSPGGELHGCKETKNKLTMSTDNPLVVALGGYEVIQKAPNGLPFLEPVMSVPKNSGPFNEMLADTSQGTVGVEMTKPNVALAASANPRWARQPWPTSAKP